jgi:hypothetical protein
MAPEDSPLHGRLLFLVGARRSGTNWLMRILRSHREIACVPPETYVFNLGVRPLRERFQHGNPGSLMMATMFAERDGFVQGMRSLLDRAFLDNLERLDTDARYLIERTPWHVYDLDLIGEIYPDARVIHIIRDGRAVARSLLAKDWGPDTMEEAAEEWRSSVAAGRREGAAFGERYREVSYERLLADPGAGVDGLFEWLGLELDPDARERIILEARSEFNVDPGKPGISADKWRGALSASQLATFQRIAGGQMAELGYPADAGAGATGRARETAEARLRAARGAATKLRHPREAIRKGVENVVARTALRTVEDNYEVVERLEKALDRGRGEEAISYLAPGARVRIGDGTEMRDHRGEGAGRALVEFFEEHRALGPRQLWGQVHSRPNMFTTVSAYELPGGGRWVRTVVLNVSNAGTITEATLYRFALADEGGTSPPAPEAELRA